MILSPQNCALLFDAALLQPKPGDRLVLTDALLCAALDGTRPLRRSEWNRLVDSPLTLRRLRRLLAERSAQASADRPADVAGWTDSVGLLRAAADGGLPAALRTDDQCWTLHFLQAPEGWRLLLNLDPGAPFAEALVESGRAVVLCDGADTPLLAGPVDADYELSGEWTDEEAPAARLARFGGEFSVNLLG